MRNIRYNGINMGFPSAICNRCDEIALSAVKRIPEAKGTQDYFGFNYYSVDTVWFDMHKTQRVILEQRLSQRRGSER